MMGNRMKRLLILNFAFFTVMYLAYLFKTASEEDWFASRSASRYLQVEYLGSEHIGGFGETDWGAELEAVPGYGWYSLKFRVENKGSQAYREIPESAVSFPGTQVRSWTYAGKDLEDEESFYGLAAPYLPGETGVEVQIYVQVLGSEKEILAEYRPAVWEEAVELEISLDGK